MIKIESKFGNGFVVDWYCWEMFQSNYSCSTINAYRIGKRNLGSKHYANPIAFLGTAQHDRTRRIHPCIFQGMLIQGHNAIRKPNCFLRLIKVALSFTVAQSFEQRRENWTQRRALRRLVQSTQSTRGYWNLQSKVDFLSVRGQLWSFFIVAYQKEASRPCHWIFHWCR